MHNYLCSLFFNHDSTSHDKVFFLAKKVLGFYPSVMDIYINNEVDQLFEIKYNEDILKSSVEKKAFSIVLKNKPYEENSEYYWFRHSINVEYNICELTWFNTNVDFLLNASSFTELIKREDFIYGFCCDSDDMYDQSTENIEYLQEKYPNKKIKKRKNSIGTIIVDTSDHWGRTLKAGGISFIAAPIMWFSKNFYSIISQEKLLAFHKASIISFGKVEIININLFNLFLNHSADANRNYQKEFWDFFDFQNVINNYNHKKETEIGITDLVQEFSKRKKKRWF